MDQFCQSLCMIELIPVTAEAFEQVLKKSIQGFADEAVAVGRWPVTDAFVHAKQIIEDELPDGMYTEHHEFFHICDSNEQRQVGHLWLETTFQDNLPTLFVSDIEIESPYRRKGYAEATFKALELLAKNRNINRICLHVFQPNKAAQTLYQKLGFHVTGMSMLKNLND